MRGSRNCTVCGGSELHVCSNVQRLRKHSRAGCGAGPVVLVGSERSKLLAALQVLASEGVTRYDPLGDAFDPNLHNALFEVPDATKEPGTIAVVVKVGGVRGP